MNDSPDLAAAVLADFSRTFRQYKALADKALAQLRDDEWLLVPAPGSNSVAVIVQHMAGNLRSRFTDFLTTDGEKPNRQREQEFAPPASAAAVAGLRAAWEEAWQILFDTLGALSGADLLRTVRIRHEPHTVVAALQRQLAHHCSHVGQLVLLAKLLRGADFESLSIPPGHSAAFNQQKAGAAAAPDGR